MMVMMVMKDNYDPVLKMSPVTVMLKLVCCLEALVLRTSGRGRRHHLYSSMSVHILILILILK